MTSPWRTPAAPPATPVGGPSGAPPTRPHSRAERLPDVLPALALAAAALARIAPSATIATRVDVLLAILVLVTAMGIDPRRLWAVNAQWRTVLLLAVVPLVALAAGAWGLAQLVHGDSRDGVLALGLSPTEVASVALIGLIGGAAELGVAVVAVSLMLSALAGPPALALLGGAAHAAPVLPLVGRFALVVVLPLAVGLAARGLRPGLAGRAGELSAVSCLAVVVLVYASLSSSRGGGLGSAALVSAPFLAFSALVAVGAPLAFGRRFDGSLALTIGMRDFAVAAALAAGAFGAGATHVAGVYGVMMLLAGAGATGLVRRARRRRPSAGR